MGRRDVVRPRLRQLAGEEAANVRRVERAVQVVERVMARSFGGDEVVDRDASADSTDAHHLGECTARVQEVVQRSAADDEKAVVFLNDQEYGIIETMRNIPKGRISEVRYIRGVDAVNRYGAQYGGGIIMLISRNQ